MTTYHAYRDTLQDDQGRPIPGASVTASLWPSGTATIYADPYGLVPVSGVVSDANGYFEFFAAPGRYSVLIQAVGLGTLTRAPVDLGNVEAPVFGPSGPLHSTGLAPDPGGVPGTARFLREDATWVDPLAPRVAMVPLSGYVNNWEPRLTGTYGVPSATVDACGNVWLRGSVSRSTGSSGPNETLFVLDTAFRPPHSVSLLAISDAAAGFSTITATSSGLVQVAASGVAIVTFTLSFPSAALG